MISGVNEGGKPAEYVEASATMRLTVHELEDSAQIDLAKECLGCIEAVLGHQTHQS